jgi:hypothetical protein
MRVYPDACRSLRAPVDAMSLSSPGPGRPVQRFYNPLHHVASAQQPHVKRPHAHLTRASRAVSRLTRVIAHALAHAPDAHAPDARTPGGART